MSVREYRVGLQTVRLVVDVPASGWVQLAHAFFPATVVTRNGRPIEAMRSTLGLTVVRVPAGRDVIELRAGETPLRRAAIATSVIGLIAIGAVSARLGSRRRPDR